MIQDISLFIKPASGLCNLQCTYCFYYDTLSKRTSQDLGMMTTSALKIIVKKALDCQPRRLSFAFQGGEPTLVGLPFFEALVYYVKEFNSNATEVYYSLQTNGILLDNHWAKFLKKHNFLVGLSIDGTKAIHDANRLDKQGKCTHDKIMNTIKLLQGYGVEFNTLSVVTADVAKNIADIFHFFKKNGIQYMQFIPCLDPLYETRGKYDYSLTVELYELFLKTLFDLWFDELKSGGYTYIRHFESLIFLMKGLQSPTCSMNGCCINQMVIEADGSVYPCDFYVLDQYKIGNIVEEEISAIMERGECCQFISEEPPMIEGCGECKWYNVCRGGCRRDWQVTYGFEHNYYCKAFHNFFEYAYTRLKWVSDRVVLPNK